MRSFRKLVPVTCIAAILVSGAVIQSVSAQPERPRDGRPSQQPGRPGGESPPPQRGPGERGPADRGPGERRAAPSVEGALRMMNRSLRELSEGIGEGGRKEANLAAVSGVQRAAMAAKSGRPEQARDDKMVEEFRREQIKLLSAALELEVNILDGDGAAARASLAKVTGLRDAAHKRLGLEVREDDQGPGEGRRPERPRPNRGG